MSRPPVDPPPSRPRPAATRLLLTGFGPFGPVASNPTEHVARALARDAACRGRGVRTAVLPVHRRDAPLALQDLLRRHRPDVLVLTGVAVGRRELCVERIGVNCFRRAGDRGPGRPIVPGGPDGLFATLPPDACLGALDAAGAPAALSFSAGTFACNLVLYLALRWRELAQHHAPPLVGFVHVPAAEDTLGRPAAATPVVPLATSLRALRALALELGAGAR